MDKPTDKDPAPPSEEEFEEMVAAALKVDPKGISGKHRKPGKEPGPTDPRNNE